MTFTPSTSTTASVLALAIPVSIIYGIYLTLYISTIYIILTYQSQSRSSYSHHIHPPPNTNNSHISRNSLAPLSIEINEKRNQRKRLGHISLITLIFILVSINFILGFFSSDTVSAAGDTRSIGGEVLGRMNEGLMESVFILGEVIILYKCYILYNSSLVITFAPFAVLLGLGVVSTLSLLRISPKIQPSSPIYFGLFYGGLVLSNSLITGLSVWRIYWMRKRITTEPSSNRKSSYASTTAFLEAGTGMNSESYEEEERYTSAMNILLTSNGLYTFFLVFLIIFKSLHNTTSNPTTSEGLGVMSDVIERLSVILAAGLPTISILRHYHSRSRSVVSPTLLSSITSPSSLFNPNYPTLAPPALHLLPKPISYPTSPLGSVSIKAPFTPPPPVTWTLTPISEKMTLENINDNLEVGSERGSNRRRRADVPVDVEGER